MPYELNPPFDEQEREVLEEIRSRVNIANAVASARVRLGLTQDELGRRAGSKQSRISELESMQGNLRLDTLDRIARELGLMIDLIPRARPTASVSGEVTAKPYKGLRFARAVTGEHAVTIPPEWTAKATV